MIKIPIRHLANLQDTVKFLTLTFGAVITLDFAGWFWSGNFFLSVWQLVAIVLVIASAWIIYLSSINSLLKPCISKQDLDLIPRKDERGAIFSVYCAPTPCDRTFKIPLLEGGIEDNVTIEKEITLKQAKKGDIYSYIKDEENNIYKVEEQAWDLWGEKLIIGKTYRLIMNKNGMVVDIIEIF
jgi:hypothetical protein